ncbi:hypothetical protein SADUNF_Sadunf02G0015400 [Salix dunnii]|uniref:Inhibitor I9 domain-containing protein n=1 Tax=Salix dunnii TaxID=1413687 RepID=A0A835N5N3_9ROSI|nr:hypothetical protein SADUNF_Sadunf02G0015400 [Salix dunnii]
MKWKDEIENIRRKNALVQSYKHGISGFAARLTAPEAQSIAENHGVLSVFPDTVYHPHTTRSWDFLKKVNGSRSYIDSADIADGLSPSDTMWHGTHVASTASGTMVPRGSFYGLAIRAFHAVENGITVVCSAENEGPTKETDTNVAPWILTVAATTDRKFFCLMLCWVETRNCNPDSMVGVMIKEKIVICENDDETPSQYVNKEEVQSSGGIGIVLDDNKTRGFADNFMEFPMTVTSSKDAAEPDIAAPRADMVAA